MNTYIHSNIDNTNLINIMNSHILYTEINLKGFIDNVSSFFCKTSGFSQNELFEKSHENIIHPDYNEVFFDNIFKEVQINKIWEGEIKYLHKNGLVFYLYTIITAKYKNNKELVGYTTLHYDITHKKKLEASNLVLSKKIKEQNKTLETIPKNIQESIKYASIIQGAALPNNELFFNYFKESFVVWHPKEVVGGDIYLLNELRHEGECLLMFIDCTGHGVPGAFITMLIKSVEIQIIAKIKNEPNLDVSPAWIMSYFNKILKKLLKQENLESISNVGFDGGIIYYNKQKKLLKFSGAESSLYYIDNNSNLQTIRGNKYSVGYKKCDFNYSYKESIINVEEGMKFYCTTDGYMDQNGGTKDFPFGKRRFKDLIKKYHEEPMAEQQELFLYELDEYVQMQNEVEQTDDITLIAFVIDEVNSLKTRI